jgi:hypothetical protein
VVHIVFSLDKIWLPIGNNSRHLRPPQILAVNPQQTPHKRIYYSQFHPLFPLVFHFPWHINNQGVITNNNHNNLIIHLQLHQLLHQLKRTIPNKLPHLLRQHQLLYQLKLITHLNKLHIQHNLQFMQLQ